MTKSTEPGGGGSSKIATSNPLRRLCHSGVLGHARRNEHGAHGLPARRHAPGEQIRSRYRARELLQRTAVSLCGLNETLDHGNQNAPAPHEGSTATIPPRSLSGV